MMTTKKKTTHKTSKENIFITGATGGLGTALTKSLANKNVHLILLAKDSPELEALDDYVKQKGAECTMVPFDLQHYPALDQLAAPFAERFVHLDHFISCAADLGPLMPTEQIPPAKWRLIIDTNLTANWQLLRVCSPLLERAKNGRVTFCTGTSLIGAFDAAYSTSKAGLNALLKTYAREKAHTKIRANLIDPGPMKTNLRKKAFEKDPLDTLPTPEEIAIKILPYLQKDYQETGQYIEIPNQARSTAP